MGSWRAHGDSSWGLVTHLVDRRAGRDVVVDKRRPTSFSRPRGTANGICRQRMRLKLREGFVDVNVQHSTTTDVPRFDVYNDRVGALPKWAEWHYGPQTRTMLGATHQWAFSDRWVWTTLGSLQEVEESRIKRRFGQGQRVSQLEQVRVWGWTSVLRGRIREWRVEGGLDGQWKPSRIFRKRHRHRHRHPEPCPNPVRRRRIFHERFGGVCLGPTQRRLA